LHIPHHTLTRALMRKRIVLTRKVRARFARRRIIKTAQAIRIVRECGCKIGTRGTEKCAEHA